MQIRDMFEKQIDEILKVLLKWGSLMKKISIRN